MKDSIYTGRAAQTLVIPKTIYKYIVSINSYIKRAPWLFQAGIVTDAEKRRWDSAAAKKTFHNSIIVFHSIWIK